METQTIKLNFEKQLAPLEKKIKNIDYASMKITSEQTLCAVLNARTDLDRISKQVLEAKKSITDPLNLAIKNVRELFRPLESKIVEYDTHLYDEIQKWRTAKEKETAAKMVQIEADIKAGKLTLEKAGTKIEKAQAKTAAIPSRTLTRARVTDLSQIPVKYIKDVDLKRIEDDLKAGIKVPGAELYQMTITVRS